MHKNEISVIDSTEGLTDLSEAAKIVSGHVPVVLNIDGWGVLVKDNKSGNGSIPVDDKEFFLKEHSSPDEKGSLFSIIRVDLLKSIIDNCYGASLNITGITAGPFNVALLSSYFEEGSEIKAGRWNIMLKHGYIQSCEAARLEMTSKHHIGGEVVTSSLITLFADVVAFFSGQRENHPVIAKYREEFVYGRLIKYITVISLSVMLLLLLLNFFTWDNLRKRHEDLVAMAASNEQLLVQLEAKGKDLKQKKILVAQYIGSSEKTHYAWFADRLCTTLPSGLRLTIMAVQPLVKKQKPDTPIEYRNRIIVIEGDASHMSDISDWMDSIKNEDWVKQVELISYHSDEDQSSGDFKLQIKY